MSKSKVLSEFKYMSGDGREGNVTLLNDSLRIHLSPEVYIFDLEGRPVFIYYKGVLYERGLSNEFVAKKWISFDPPRRYLERVKDEELKKRIVDYAHKRVKEALDNEPPSEIHATLNRILQMDYEKLRADAYRFYSIYKPISILPPDQYLSLVFQPIEGCPYNRCSFCTFYRDRGFRFKSVDEFRGHVKSVLNFLGESILLRRRVFLADANALVAPTNLLVKYIEIIYEYIGRSFIEGIYSFMDYFTVKKSLDDFKLLKDLGLKMVYIGLETGDPDILKILNKPGPPTKAIEIVKRIKRAGINVGVIILIGAGGKRFFNEHVENSIEVLNEMPLDRHDIIYFSKLKITPESEYYRLIHKHDLKYLDDYEMDIQINLIKEGLRHREKPILAIYDIDEFVY